MRKTWAAQRPSLTERGGPGGRSADGPVVVAGGGDREDSDAERSCSPPAGLLRKWSSSATSDASSAVGYASCA